MKKRTTSPKKLTLGKYSLTIETPMFSPKGHITFTGFGAHRNNKKKKDRVQSRKEERRWYDAE